MSSKSSRSAGANSAVFSASSVGGSSLTSRHTSTVARRSFVQFCGDATGDGAARSSTPASPASSGPRAPPRLSVEQPHRRRAENARRTRARCFTASARESYLFRFGWTCSQRSRFKDVAMMRQRRVKSLPRHGRVFLERVGVDERARGGETFVPGFHAIPRFRERIFVVILLEWQRRVQQKVTRLP